jgi:hypothetical protein
MAMDATRVMNGSYGEVWSEGVWYSNVTQAEATVEVGKEEVKRAGTRWIGQKVTSLKGSGTITGYKVTTALIQKVGGVANDRNKPFVTELIMKLDDPEAWGAYRVRLKGVQFDKIDLIKYEVGALVEEEWPFTFTGFDLLDTVKEG